MQISLSCSAALFLLGADTRAYVASNSIQTGVRRTDKEGNPMFASIIRFLREWRAYNRSLSELNSLGDRELADIGISRSDIPRVAWNSAHRR